jgi:UDP-N-acetylmuramoyl-tripeptide--D-alanyl-D-alanine ligase
VSATSVWILCIGLLLFGWRRILSYLRYFQQEEYSARRFWSWIIEKRAFDTRGSATILASAALLWAIPGSIARITLSAVAAIVLVWIAWRYEEDPRTTGKIKLNMTQRATKIAQGARLIFSVCAIAPALMSCSSCYQAGMPPLKLAILGVLIAQAPPILLMLANALLWPAEKALQDRFIADAKRILKEVDPFVIGITGSYGKTGAKAALGEILTQTLGATFWPRKSINTVLGITRTIREQMRPFHKFAVIEMGAYNIGSIKRLCDFTPPKASLVTAVGIMHLERFGSPENVYVAKSEIAQALPVEGILVCNGDSPNARRMAREHPRQTTLLYGLDPGAGPLDCFATDISFSEQGTRFVIHWKGNNYPARTPLLGRPALLNILGAFTMACALGADPAYAAATLANLEPVDNRLVLEKNRDVSYLRDAYNSNPTGFAAALEVLRDLPAGRRILMTPGMIELGDQQFEHNKQVASMAAKLCDLIIVVGKVNREALLAGLTAAQFPSDKLIVVDTRDEAFKVIKSRGVSGDLVLIENDLGDLHEGRIRF